MSDPASGSLAPLAPKPAAVAQSRQVASLLRLGAERKDRHRDRPERRIEGENQAGVGTTVTEPFHGRDGRGDVGALAAVLVGNGQPEDAESPAPFVALAPELAALFARNRFGIDQLVAGEPHRGVMPLLLLFGQTEVHDLDLLVCDPR